MASAITRSLTGAFPKAAVTVNISENLVLAHDENGFYFNLGQFAQVVKHLSQATIRGTTYSGVLISITPDGKNIRVWDSTYEGPSKLLAFTDLIGQPTWIESGTVQFKCPMRADLGLGDSVQFPFGIVGTTTSASQPQGRPQQGAFNGKFTISAVRHVGRFRDPDPAGWVSVFNAIAPGSFQTGAPGVNA